MIRNFLFDIGNVLLAFDLAPALAELHQRDDISRDEALDRLIHFRDLMESGDLTPGEFLAHVKESLGFPGTVDEASAIYADIFTPILPVWKVAESLLAEGYRLVLFSNISPIHVDFITGRYPIIARFPEAIFSFRSGDIKPRDGMYVEAVEKLGLVPEETFYLDDNAANIATGKKFGFVTHTYDLHNHRALLDDLAAAKVAGILLD